MALYDNRHLKFFSFSKAAINSSTSQNHSCDSLRTSCAFEWMSFTISCRQSSLGLENLFDLLLSNTHLHSLTQELWKAKHEHKHLYKHLHKLLSPAHL